MSHHSHHDHLHHSHLNSSPSPETDITLNSVPATTLASLLQTVMSSVVAHDGQDLGHHQRHHAGHSMDTDHNSYLTNVHTDHVSSEGHMPMYFHFGVDNVILFKEWSTSTTEGLIGSLIGIFILAMLYEGIKFFRECLFKKYFTSLEYSSVSVLGDDGKPVTEIHKVARNNMMSWPHIFQTALHVMQMVLSYFLMLIFMTYNIWLCLAVVCGAGFGYFLFGWRKATVVDITEHCH